MGRGTDRMLIDRPPRILSLDADRAGDGGTEPPLERALSLLIMALMAVIESIWTGGVGGRDPCTPEDAEVPDLPRW